MCNTYISINQLGYFNILFIFSIQAMASLARTAIENEQKLQSQLILEDKAFLVDLVSSNYLNIVGFCAKPSHDLYMTRKNVSQSVS